MPQIASNCRNFTSYFLFIEILETSEEHSFHLQFLNRKRPVGSITLNVTDRMQLDQIASELDIPSDATFSQVMRQIMDACVSRGFGNNPGGDTDAQNQPGNQGQAVAITEQSQKQLTEAMDELPGQSEQEKTEQSPEIARQSESKPALSENQIILEITDQDKRCLSIRKQSGKSIDMPQMVRQALNYVNKKPVATLFTGSW